MAHQLVISVGCPSGIGPEVAVVAASKPGRARLLLVGDVKNVELAARAQKVATPVVRVATPEEGFRARGVVPVYQPTADLAARDRVFGRPSAAGGAAQLAWIDAACDLAASGVASALVTGPVSKEVIARSKTAAARAFTGHTEHLARRLHAREVVMAFVSETLTTALVTTHLALAEVPAAINKDNVASATVHLARLLFALAPRGTHERKVAVASLNPHAGEGGLFGAEESRAIVPGIALARKRLLGARVRAVIEGPVPAETAFRRAVGGHYDGVVAMYHDQATIPMKCVAFGEAVNVTLGLPIIRTSVDHGTGYDIAGRGIADADGVRAAIVLADRLIKAGFGARD